MQGTGFADTLSQNGLTEFLAIDLTGFDDKWYYYVNAATMNQDDPTANKVTWNGKEWGWTPFESTGWQRGGEKSTAPRINLPDFNGALFLLLRQYGGAVGATIERYQVLNPQSTGTQPYTYERYLLNSFEATGKTCALELKTHFDLTQGKLPAFKMYRKDFPGLGSALQA